MAEFDTIFVSNPTDKDFEVRKNGELYKLKAKEETTVVHDLARHMAKHLSDRMLNDDVLAEQKKLARRKEQMPEAKKIMKVMYDNPQRRIYLYDILQDKTEVERTIKAYPQFKASETRDNFVGEISEYDDYVIKFESSKVKESIPTEEPKKVGRPKKVTSEE